MVTAMSLGPAFSRPRHCDASHSSAVESGPPDTASTTAPALFRSENSLAASADEIGEPSRGSFAPPSRGMALPAVLLLLAIDALLHAARRARIFAGDLAEGGAGRFLLLQC